MAFQPTALEPSTTELATSTVVLSEATVHLMFLDLMMEPLPDLVVKVTLRGKETTLTTDSTGCVPGITAPCGTKITIAVARFDGGFKEIENTVIPGAESTWNYISPQLVLEAETELHAGAPGDIEKMIPKEEPTKSAPTEKSETAKPAPPAKSIQSSPTPASAKTPKKSEAAKADVPANSPEQRKSPTKTPTGKPATETSSGRTTDGSPMQVVKQKIIDWLDRWSLPTWSILPAAGKNKATSDRTHNPKNGPNTPTQSQSTNNSIQAISASKVAFRQDMVAKVRQLIEFAEMQTEYVYGTNEGTVYVIGQMAKRTFNHSPGEKSKNSSVGRCYQYVRIALSRAGIVDGYLAEGFDSKTQESASLAGAPLLKKGYVEVTDEIPDPRWAAAGDIIVYRWSDQTWESRKKKKGANTPNHGHIDIRSTSGYISDFIPSEKSGGHPTWTSPDKSSRTGYTANYVNMKIYRKVYDPTPYCRMLAFLYCIREFECQQEPVDQKRYFMLNTPLPGANSKVFENLESHPWKIIPKNAWPKSTASGAYQITCTTWQGIIDKELLNEPDPKKLFTIQAQDRIAAILIESRNALSDVRNGQIGIAIEKLRTEWTSLPGAKENSHRKNPKGGPLDFSYFEEKFNEKLKAELAKFGI